MAPEERTREWEHAAPSGGWRQEPQQGHQHGHQVQQTGNVHASPLQPPPPPVFDSHPSNDQMEAHLGVAPTTAALSTTSPPYATSSLGLEGGGVFDATGSLQQQQRQPQQTTRSSTQFSNGHPGASFATPAPLPTPSTMLQPAAPMTVTQPHHAPNYDLEPNHQRAGASTSQLGNSAPKTSPPSAAAAGGGAGGAGAQLAGWAVRPPTSGGGAYAANGAQVETPAGKTAWGAAGLASDGLAPEERELEAVLEASRLAEEARQREEMESKMAMDVRGRCAVWFQVARFLLYLFRLPYMGDDSDPCAEGRLGCLWCCAGSNMKTTRQDCRLEQSYVRGPRHSPSRPVIQN